VAVGGWGLVVGIMALGVWFTGHPWRFHAAAWTLGMAVLTPLWALIEWQDNGAFERWSDASRPGDWDPWILTVALIWALSILALYAFRRRRGEPT
jgi:MYXO-CTERM domain-containing protein